MDTLCYLADGDSQSVIASLIVPQYLEVEARTCMNAIPTVIVVMRCRNAILPIAYVDGLLYIYNIYLISSRLSNFRECRDLHITPARLLPM